MPHPFLLSLVVLLAASLVGQDGVLATSCGVTVDDGLVRAGGHGYTATFTGDGLSYTPLGRSGVARALQISWQEVRRDGEVILRRRAAAQPVVTAAQVRYQHLDVLAEVLDVRSEGVEQSFVVHEPLPGRGDLVVRCAVLTSLPFAAIDRAGATFADAEIGVHIGTVAGFDAAGVRVAGELRCDGKSLDLVLPAAFVDHATYPLTVDPLIGSVFGVGNGAAGTDVRPDIAYDESSQRWLCVWTVSAQPSLGEVRGQLIDVGGNLVGNQLLLASTTAPGVTAVVANVNDSNRFVVVWPSGGVVEGRAVTPATGAMSNIVTFWTGASQVADHVVVGGDSRTPIFGSADRAMLAIAAHAPTLSRFLHRVVVTVPSTGDPSVAVAAGSPLVSYGPSVYGIGGLAISRHGGGDARWLVTFARGSTVSSTIEGVVLNTSGSSCSSIATLATGVGFGSATAAATVDGADFLAAWVDDATGALRCRRLAYQGTCGSGTLVQYGVVDPVGPGGVLSAPHLDCAKDKYLLTYETRTASGATPHVRLLGLSLANGSAAGVPWNPSGITLGYEEQPVVASRFAGGDIVSDEALVVWSNGTIRARRAEAIGQGTVTNLGGACGVAGVTDVVTYSGNPALGTSFSIDLATPTSPVLALAVGFSAVSFVCGPCTLVPSPDLLLPAVLPTGIQVPLQPSLIGASLWMQWVQWRPSGCAILPDFGFSDALRFQIGE